MACWHPSALSHKPWAKEMATTSSKFLWGTDKDGKSLAPSVSIFGMHPFASGSADAPREATSETTQPSTPIGRKRKRAYLMQRESYDGRQRLSVAMLSKGFAGRRPTPGEVAQDAVIDSGRTLVRGPGSADHRPMSCCCEILRQVRRLVTARAVVVVPASRTSGMAMPVVARPVRIVQRLPANPGRTAEASHRDLVWTPAPDTTPVVARA